jgi:hypothetical protein
MMQIIPRYVGKKSLPREFPRRRARPSLKDLEWQENLEPKQARELDLTPMREPDLGRPRLARQCCMQPQLWIRAWPCQGALSLSLKLMGKVKSTGLESSSF